MCQIYQRRFNRTAMRRVKKKYILKDKGTEVKQGTLTTRILCQRSVFGACKSKMFAFLQSLGVFMETCSHCYPSCCVQPIVGYILSSRQNADCKCFSPPPPICLHGRIFLLLVSVCEVPLASCRHTISISPICAASSFTVALLFSDDNLAGLV